MTAVILEIPHERMTELWSEFRASGHTTWEDWCVRKFGHAIKFGTRDTAPFCYITFSNEEDAVQFKLAVL